MITFDVLNSADPEIPKEFLSYFDKFILGSSNRSDIIINDKDISPLHLKLEVKEETLFCKSYDQDQSFKVNGKKYSGSKVIKVNDIIAVGQTEIKITNFSKMDIDPVDNMDELYKQAIEKVPELEEIIFQLEKEILILERNDDVQK